MIRDFVSLAPVIPVLTISKLEHAAPLARALARGGLPVLEVTLRTPVALEAIAAMRRAAPDAVIGAGTLVKPADFAAAERAGAQFLVTPGLTAELIEAARQVRAPLLPGVMTPSELIAARAAGFDTLKFFPAQQAGGVAMLKAFAGPFGDIRFCPTGGITLESAPSFLSLPNVACVGGSWFAPAASLEAGDFDSIEALARQAASLSRPNVSHRP